MLKLEVLINQQKLKKREVAFNKKLDNLIKIRFGFEDDRGIIFYYIIELKDELESYIKTGNENFDISLWHNEQQISSKELLIDILKNLDMGQWRRRYSMTDFGYPETDGSYWHLRLEFGNGYRAVTFSGNEVYPYNFYELLELFGIEE